MKKTLHRTEKKINLTRLVIYLVIVAAFGLLNTFIGRNSDRTAQDVKFEKSLYDLSNDLVGLKTISQQNSNAIDL